MISICVNRGQRVNLDSWVELNMVQCFPQPAENVPGVCGNASRRVRRTSLQSVEILPAVCGKTFLQCAEKRFCTLREAFPHTPGTFSAGCGFLLQYAELTLLPAGTIPLSAENIPAVCGQLSHCLWLRRVLVNFPQCADPLQSILLGHHRYRTMVPYIVPHFGCIWYRTTVPYIVPHYGYIWYHTTVTYGTTLWYRIVPHYGYIWYHTMVPYIVPHYGYIWYHTTVP